jgi:hypothetical protein
MNNQSNAVVIFFTTIVFAACAGTPTVSNSVKDHEAALSATDPRVVPGLAPGGPEEKAVLERFEAFISDLSTSTVQRAIRDVYAPKLFFNDTLKTIRDVDALEKYFLATNEAMSSYGLKIEQVVSTPEGAYIRWRMDVMFKRFRKGEVHSSIGMTHLRFDRDGRVIYHQDYWDSGSALFEKIPVLGGGIRAVKKRP